MTLNHGVVFITPDVSLAFSIYTFLQAVSKAYSASIAVKPSLKPPGAAIPPK